MFCFSKLRLCQYGISWRMWWESLETGREVLTLYSFMFGLLSIRRDIVHFVLFISSQIRKEILEMWSIRRRSQITWFFYKSPYSILISMILRHKNLSRIHSTTLTPSSPDRGKRTHDSLAAFLRTINTAPSSFSSSLPLWQRAPFDFSVWSEVDKFRTRLTSRPKLTPTVRE